MLCAVVMEPDSDEQQYPGEEGLSWTDGNKNTRKPKGLYSRTSEVARGFISSKTQCALFCGGRKCKYCSDTYWSAEEMVIKGLYSQWVTNNILAMARPSNAAIKKYDIIKQFQEKGIKTVINLQLPYEHADCGPHELDQSGFLYDPQTFMGNEIFYYNFGWSDYGVASLSTILDIVKVMQFAVTQGKVAIHCHAGRGRTGVIIACYLVFTNRISSQEAIHYVRVKRPNSIQTRPQMQVIEEFEMYLRPFRTVFASRLKDSHEFSLQQFLNRQQHILHGYEARRLKHIPKILYTVCERLLELAKKGSSLQNQYEKVQPKLEQNIVFPMMQCSTVQAISLETQSKPNGSHNATGKRRYKQSIARFKNRTKSISLEDLPNAKFKAVLDDPEVYSMQSLNNVTSSMTLAGSDFDDDSNSIVFGNSWTDIKSLTNSSRHKVVDKMFYQVCGSSESLNDWSTHSSVMTTDMSEDCVQLVAQALSASIVQDYVKERAKSLEDLLNTSDSAWINLCIEGDPYVLSLLLWDWLDQLKEPVLRAQDLSLMLEWVHEPQTGLLTIEKGTRYTLEYLMKVLSKLKPLKKLTAVSVYEKLLSHLTHQWVVLNNADGELSWAESSKSANNVLTYKDHWGIMKSEMVKKLITFIENLQHDIQSARLVSATDKI